MKNLLYTPLLAFSLFACGSSNKPEETKDVGSPIDKAEMAVMAVHDEAMPRLDDMMKLKKQINARVSKLDSLQGTPAERLHADEEQAQGRLIVRHLTQADSLMFGWMNQYNGDTLKKIPEADALRYLDGQQKIVNDVKTRINGSIEQAKNYLKQ